MTESKIWYEASAEAGRRRDNPKRAPLTYHKKEEVLAWKEGYDWAMNELAQNFNMRRIAAERRGE